MSDFAYHQEARRKARLLERKHEALDRLGTSQQSGYANLPNPPKREESGYFEKQSPSTPCIQQGTGYDTIRLPDNAKYRGMEVHSAVYKDLKNQEKRLRNNNMVMGPMDAFTEYFDPNASRPSYKKF